MTITVKVSKINQTDSRLKKTIKYANNMKFIILIISLSTSMVIHAQSWVSGKEIHKIREYETARYYFVKGIKNKKISKKGFISIDFMEEPHNALALDNEYNHVLIDSMGKKISVTPLGYTKSIIPRNYNYVDGKRDDKRIKLLTKKTNNSGINARNIAFLNDYGKPSNFLDNVASGFNKKISDHFFFETINENKKRFLVVTNNKGVLQGPPTSDYYSFSVITNSIANDNFDIFYEVYALPHPENKDLMIPITSNGSPAPMLENNIIGYLPFYDTKSAVRKQANSDLIHSWIGVHAMDDGSFKYSYASPGFEFQSDAVFINTDWTFKQESSVKSYFLYGEVSPGKYGLYWFDTANKAHWYHYKRVDDINYNKYSVVDKIKNIKYDLEAPKRRYYAELQRIARSKEKQKKWEEDYRRKHYQEFTVAMSQKDYHMAKNIALYLKGEALAQYCTSQKCSQHQIREAIATSKGDKYYNKLRSQLQYRTDSGTANWHQQLQDWSNDLDQERDQRLSEANPNLSQIIQDGMQSWKADQQSKTNRINRKANINYTKNLKNWTYGKQNWKPAKPTNN